MIILDSTTRTIEVLLAGAVTTNQLPIVASYVDITTNTYTPASSNAATNNTTAVTVVAAPAASTERQIKLMTVYNADTISATLTVRYNDNGTTRIITNTTLSSRDSLMYTDGEGFRVIDANGNYKTSVSGGGITLTTVGSSPNSDGASLTGQQALTLQPADATHPGLVTSGTQTLGGDKTITIVGSSIDNTTTNQSYRPTNAQTGTTYTLVLSDGGRMVTLNNALAITLTIPANASVAFPVGTEIDLIQLGGGQVTVAITSDTLNSSGAKVRLAGQYAGATLKKIANTNWVLIGNLT